MEFDSTMMDSHGVNKICFCVYNFCVFMNLGTFKTTGVIQCRDLISLMLHINNAKNNLKRVE